MKGALSQSAQSSHTQLAHALVQYLGVEAPTDLEKYGIRSAGDLVDLISKVGHSDVQPGREAHNLCSKVFHEYAHRHDPKPDADRASCLADVIVI